MITKGLSTKGFQDSEAHAMIRMYGFIAELKNLYRQGWINHQGVPQEHTESVGDHTFASAFLTYMIAREYRPDLDAEHVMKLALFHDIAEAVVGDISPRDGNMTQEERDFLEERAANDIFLGLKNSQEYIGYWREVMLLETDAAKFVKQVEKLDAAMMAHLYDDIGYGKAMKDFEHNVEKLSPSPEIQGIIDALRKRD